MQNRIINSLKSLPINQSLILCSFSHSLIQAGHIAEAIAECTEVLEGDENDLEALVERAEAYLIEEMYDEGEEEGYDRMTREKEGGGIHLFLTMSYLCFKCT